MLCQEVFTVLVVYVLRIIDTATIKKPGNLPTIAFRQHGEYIIGASMPVHSSSPDSVCSNQIGQFKMYQSLESIVFTVNEINQRQDLLPNTTLGFVVIDDCSKDTTSLTRTLHFVQNTKPVSENRSKDFDEADTEDIVGYDVIGVIGSESSKSTVQMADMLSMFKVPQISYISTSPLLSNKRSYPYFSRIVPSDKLQVQVLVDIIAHFNWTYVSIVYEAGSYGVELYKAFRKLAESRGYCLGKAIMVPEILIDDEADKVVRDLLSVPRARAVVLVLSGSRLTSFFDSVRRLGHVGYFTWLGPDAWGSHFQDYLDIEDVALGSITTGFPASYVHRLDDYVKYITANNGSHNPWFEEFFEKRYDCRFHPGPNDTTCRRNQSFAENYMPHWICSLIVDTVYTFARALHNALDGCQGVDNQRECVAPEKMLKAIRNLTFEGERGLVSFDEFGDGSATYAIRTFRKEGDTYSLVEIGRWDTYTRSFSYFNPELVTWHQSSLTDAETGSATFVSRCSDRCSPGFEAVTTRPHCCWYCEPCSVNEISVYEGDKPRCQVCPKDGVFAWPDVTRTKCLPTEINVLTLPGILGSMITTLIVITSVGALLIITIYMRKIESPLIEASSKELLFLMLTGTISANVLMIAFVVPPTGSTCVLVASGFHLSFTLTYGPFLVKTARICRLHHAHVSGGVAGHTGAFHNALYTLLIAFIQITILVASVQVDPPEPKTTMPRFDTNYVESACQLGQYGFLVSLAFNLLLLLLSTYYAIKGRHVKDAYYTHEAKFINICVYTSIVLWLAFPASYFTSARLIIRAIILCAASFANSAVFLCLLHGPKLYDLYHADFDGDPGPQQPPPPPTTTETLHTEHKHGRQPTPTLSPRHADDSPTTSDETQRSL